jgi:multiple antibiotic resistance protein
MTQMIQVFFLLFLMIGPFKIIVPFARMTQGAEPALARSLAIRGSLLSTVTLLVAAFLGENILQKYGIPIPILSLAGGLILFLVALLNVIQQFQPAPAPVGTPAAPTMAMAVNPLAFPTIVTPYGIAAVIVIMAMCPDMACKLTVLAMVGGIMALNLLVMLTVRSTLKYLVVILPILGAILGVVQVALGLEIMFKAITKLLAS